VQRAKSHAAVSSERLGDDLVQSVLCDLESSPLEEKEKALLRFSAKATKDLPAKTLAEVAQLRVAGWNDKAVFTKSLSPRCSTFTTVG
jgi:hypothetical protein